MKVDTEARNLAIVSNGSQGTARIPMCDNVSWHRTQGKPLSQRPMTLIDVEHKVTYK